jgi:hypothetical protein
MAWEVFRDDVEPMDGDRVPTDEVVSRFRVCDLCGIPFKEGDSAYRQRGFEVCERCVDLDSGRY